MLVLLPPSETKRPGGSGAPLAPDGLALPELGPVRERAVAALVALSGYESHAARVLKLSPRQLAEVAANAELEVAPTMPAVDRYTGVLYDALDAPSLTAPARRWLGGHVMIHSAPWGPIGALDPIPYYRMGAGVTLPGLPPARRVWAEAVTAALRARAPRFTLDLRSEAYAALGPLPAECPSAFVRVVSAGADGAVRALNHFNKHAKGALVRQLATARPRVGSRDALLRWAEASGLEMRPGAPGEVELRV
ncbi:YaaA family protein [Microbacterium sp. TNHR37B]|uniref:YaaA family protein n=1 Tax=Microbacterium sp. TNHR37B TaxID=1775956 RepID=UPI0007B1F0B7|nr:peroxide stress protein YaaA [Microbacterium sp. TNHR37B]KZE88918.1 hypothetical protein AVP41_01708 [Microbacterium sp. TNHR37B]